jgi:hypothetical protein
MDHLNDLADERLLNGCVYCFGGLEETRDHVPSRILLDSPFPANLPVVPACRECNAGFSSDEEYVAALLECVLAGSTDPSKIRHERVTRSLERNPALRARLELSKREENGRIVFAVEEDRVRNVICKLAKGHAAYELSTPYRAAPDLIAWRAIPEMTKNEWEDFDAAYVGGVINEIGSRNMQRLLVTQIHFESENGEPLSKNLLVNDWIEVQNGRYRYQVIDELEIVRIKIVLAEYLACEVIWNRDNH